MCEGLKTVRGSQYFRRFIRVSKALIRFFRAADLLDAAVGEPFRRVRVKARSHQGFPRRGVRRQRRLQVPFSAARFLFTRCTAERGCLQQASPKGSASPPALELCSKASLAFHAVAAGARNHSRDHVVTR